MLKSPVAPHASSAADLKERLDVEARGEPFLIYRDTAGRQVVVELTSGPDCLTIGRRLGSDIQLDWDSEVSRVHARLERIGSEWTLADDGLSRNGSFVNGGRIHGRHRVRDGDCLEFGGTSVVFRLPSAGLSTPTSMAEDDGGPLHVPPMQRQVLIALCRPFKESLFAAPTTNQAIAAELHVSVDTVKTYMRAMFSVFGIEHLPQNQKRARLAAEALKRGVVSYHEL
jgi:DNA-binding CsgD family transcriptional regulator